jgi:hypothetical protein
VVHHKYLTLQAFDFVPLQILYEGAGITSSYKERALIINTKDPSKFEQLYADASAALMKQCDV